MSVLWSESVSTWMSVGVESFWLPVFKLNISTNAAHGIVRMKAADYIQICIDSGLQWAELWDKEFVFSLRLQWPCHAVLFTDGTLY